MEMITQAGMISICALSPACILIPLKSNFVHISHNYKSDPDENAPQGRVQLHKVRYMRRAPLKLCT